MAVVPASRHNKVAKAANQRVDVLEGRLTRLLTPILEDAGREAARRFSERATSFLTAASRRRDIDLLVRLPLGERRVLVASLAFQTDDAIDAASTMVALKPRPDEAEAIAQPGGKPAGVLHVTLAYLGETTGDLREVRDALAMVAGQHAALEGVVGGVGIFAPQDGTGPAILLPDVPGLVELRVAVTEALVRSGTDYGRDHGFLAHTTVSTYTPGGGPPFKPPLPMLLPLHFDALLLVRGDEVLAEYPLAGPAPVTAAGDSPTNPTPTWGAPAPAEILDVDALVRTLRTKTDPVRLAFIDTVGKAMLDELGPLPDGTRLSWDVTNPLAGRVLAQSGSQIVGIADTTRLNVMRIIAAAYDQGLSIPDTAKAIRAGMTEAAPVRARMIARTEMSRAVNSASLASVQTVSGVTGDSYAKRWETAEGAKYPRHENYDGLDGQERGLDEAFDVGGSAMMYPSDPDGPPEESISCRCTLTYSDGTEVTGEGE